MGFTCSIFNCGLRKMSKYGSAAIKCNLQHDVALFTMRIINMLMIRIFKKVNFKSPKNLNNVLKDSGNEKLFN